MIDMCMMINILLLWEQLFRYLLSFISQKRPVTGEFKLEMGSRPKGFACDRLQLKIKVSQKPVF